MISERPAEVADRAMPATGSYLILARAVAALWAGWSSAPPRAVVVALASVVDERQNGRGHSLDQH